MPVAQTSAAPLLTFGVTTYCLPAALVSRCLESLAALPFSEGEAEIIVADDGSAPDFRDALGSVVEAFGSGAARRKGLGVRLIDVPHGGPAAARNAILDAARGTFVQFVDGDDVLLPAAYAVIVRTLRQRRASLDAIAFGYARTASPLVRSWNVLAALSLRFFARPESGANYMQHRYLRAGIPGYVFRRDALGTLRFDTRFRSEEDEAFTPRMMLRMRRVVATRLLPYVYCTREGSLTRDASAERLATRIANAETILADLRAERDALQALGNDREAVRALDRRTADLARDISLLREKRR